MAGADETQLEARARAKYRVSMNEPIREVDPSELRLPLSRLDGADSWKLL